MVNIPSSSDFCTKMNSSYCRRGYYVQEVIWKPTLAVNTGAAASTRPKSSLMEWTCTIGGLGSLHNIDLDILPMNRPVSKAKLNRLQAEQILHSFALRVSEYKAQSRLHRREGEKRANNINDHPAPHSYPHGERAGPPLRRRTTIIRLRIRDSLLPFSAAQQRNPALNTA